VVRGQKTEARGQGAGTRVKKKPVGEPKDLIF